MAGADMGMSVGSLVGESCGGEVWQMLCLKHQDCQDQTILRITDEQCLFQSKHVAFIPDLIQAGKRLSKQNLDQSC